MANKPLVSITIPSYNSEKTILACMKGVVTQTYPNIEVLVIDSHSADRTRYIATDYGAKVIHCDGKLLAARYLGVKEAKGEYIALIDTDQVLKPKTIERAVALMNYYDMIVFEEHPFNTNWFIPKLYSASKKIVNARFDKDYAFDPVKGGNPARFFRRDVLEKAFVAISEELIPETIHYDHDIIYYESFKVSPRVGILRDALYHIEPDFSKLWKTNFRYGASLRTVKGSHYWDLFLSKRGSGFRFGRPLSVGLQALLLSLILKTAQRIGYHFGPRWFVEFLLKTRRPNHPQVKDGGVMKLKTKIFELYKGRYKSVPELARAMGMSTGQIYKVRDGKRSINQKFIIGATKAFPEYKLDDLFYVAL